MIFTPPPCHKTVTLSQTTSPWSVTYFMDGPLTVRTVRSFCPLSIDTTLIMNDIFSGSKFQGVSSVEIWSSYVGLELTH